MDPFETLIHDLGNFMGIPLQPDLRQSCLLHFSEYQVSVQIDLDVNADQIIVGSELGEVFPGIYRQRVFESAMRTNFLTNLRIGTLAYSERKQTLVLFRYFTINTLTGEVLFNYLKEFIEHARIWVDAIKNGSIPLIEESASYGSGMFGLT